MVGGECDAHEFRMQAQAQDSPVLGGGAELLAAEDLDQRAGQLVHHLGAMLRARREAQALGAARDGREVDRLDVETVFRKQDVADPLASLPGSRSAPARCGVTLGITGRPAPANLAFSIAAASCWAQRSSPRRLEVADARKRPCNQDRRETGREDEARRVAADAVDDRSVGGDIATHHAKGLSKRAFDDRQPLGYPVSLGNAAAMLAVHADSMDLVEISQRVVFFSKVANRGDWRDIGVHGVNALEGDQLGRLPIRRREQLFEMLEIVVAETRFSQPSS